MDSSGESDTDTFNGFNDSDIRSAELNVNPSDIDLNSSISCSVDGDSTCSSDDSSDTFSGFTDSDIRLAELNVPSDSLHSDSQSLDQNLK